MDMDVFLQLHSLVCFFTELKSDLSHESRRRFKRRSESAGSMRSASKAKNATHHSNEHSDDITAVESDDESGGALTKKKSSTPSGIESPNGHSGEVRQENDIVISMSDDQYKEVLDPELENLMQIREKGGKPNVKESAEAVMNIFRQIIQKGGGRYLKLLKKNPTRYVEVDEDGAMDSEFIH